MDLINKIYEAGIVGCGGAGFPTHKKLDTKVEYFIINGAECEPLLRTDRYLMIKYPDELLDAIEEVGNHLSARKMYFALKETYNDEIDSLQNAINKRGSKVEIFKMENYYPAGDEHMIVYEATGTPVPPGGIPLEVNAVVSNVATMYHVYDALKDKSFTHRFLTISGEVNEPVILHVPIGTSYEKCIELAGGSKIDNFKVIEGGPLMGTILDSDELKDSYITKTISGLIVIPDDSYLSYHSQISLQHMRNRAKSSCIQCTLCTQMCPRYLAGHPLEPHIIMRKFAYTLEMDELLEDESIKQALICSECGICELFACPMQIQPRRVNQVLKAEFSKRSIRYQRIDDEYKQRPEIEYRKIASKGIANRIGVGKYYDYLIDHLVEHVPDKVVISLKQHIGTPAKSVVAVGDKVKVGQLIGLCDKETLGANIHASLEGVVAEVNNNIVIERQ